MGRKVLLLSIVVLPNATDGNVIQECSIYGSSSLSGASQTGRRDNEELVRKLPSREVKNSKKRDY